ncbi:hypothetical protein FRB99_003361 [Tulasnella sp. 403]|nr:hypothetical protein FRB99_003361 [Tulasnella sp. 403]
MISKLSVVFSLATLFFASASTATTTDHEGYSGYNNDSESNPYSGSPSPSARTIEIVVGGAVGNVYTPPVAYPEVGDTLRFTFRIKNHTVTQSSFENPCTPLPGGFTSGFRPVPDTQTGNFPYFDLKVQDKNPIYIHCEQVNHCPTGMVFAANPALEGERTFSKFLANALAVGTSAPVPAPIPAPTPDGHTWSAKFRRDLD